MTTHTTPAPSTDATADPVLAVNDLVVEFSTPEGSVRAVDGLSYEVRAGQTLAIVGESGSGKSVSSLTVMGLLRDTTATIRGGTVHLNGVDLLTLSAKQHRAVCGDQVAMVFQDALAALNPVYTVGWQLGEALRARRGMSRSAARSRAIELLDLVRVPNAKGRINDYPHQFSGGMRQRVMIASALALDPKVLIADEPTTALDVTVQAQIIRLLADIQAERQMALVLITHDLGVVANTADQVTVMYAGRSMEQAPVAELYGRSAHPYTRSLLKSIPRLDRRDQQLAMIGGRPPDPLRLPAGCPFHPRCYRAEEVCQAAPAPQPVAVSAGHQSSCHFATEVHDEPTEARA